MATCATPSSDGSSPLRIPPFFDKILFVQIHHLWVRSLCNLWDLNSYRQQKRRGIRGHAHQWGEHRALDEGCRTFRVTELCPTEQKPYCSSLKTLNPEAHKPHCISMLLYVLAPLLFACLYHVKEDYRLTNPDVVGSV